MITSVQSFEVFLFFLIFAVHIERRESYLIVVYDGKRKKDWQQAQEEMKSLIPFKTIIDVESSLDQITKNKDWKKLQQNTEASGKLCILVEV